MASSVSALIIAAAQAQGLDPALAIEIATQESGLNPNVGNGAAGEIGVMQILPSTAPGVNLNDLQTNINTGVALLAQLVSYFGGDETSAIAAYNCGQTCVSNAQANYGSNWLSYVPASTQSYVASVLNRMQSYSATINVSSIFAPSAGAASTSPLLSTGSTQLWTDVAIAVFVILGISLLLD